jgi:hypothetical protein
MQLSHRPVPFFTYKVPADDHYAPRSVKKKSRRPTPFWFLAEKKMEL